MAVLANCSQEKRTRKMKYNTMNNNEIIYLYVHALKKRGSPYH